MTGQDNCFLEYILIEQALAFMENPAPWETQSPWEREESNCHLQQLPISTFFQDLIVFTTLTPTPTPTPFSFVLDDGVDVR